MKSGIVSISQINQFGRLDAEFNLAVKSIKDNHSDLLARLESEIDPEDMIARLIKLRTEDMFCLSPFLTGNKNKNDRQSLIQAIEKYPYLCAVMIESHKDEIMKVASDRVLMAQKYLDSIETLLEKSVKKPKP